MDLIKDADSAADEPILAFNSNNRQNKGYLRQGNNNDSNTLPHREGVLPDDAERRSTHVLQAFGVIRLAFSESAVVSTK